LPFGPNTPPAAPEVNIETPSAYSLPTRPSAPTLFTNSGRDLNGQAPAAAYGVNPSNTAIAYHPAANPVDRTAAYSSTYPNTGYEGPVMPLLPESVAPPATLSANGYGNSADTSTARQNYDSLRPGLR
jgi:hypothetical protein